MNYNNIHEGVFLSRPNRFIAEVEIDGKIYRCHVKNTGRCKELLVPGAAVYVNRSDKPERTTLFDLVAVVKGKRLINMDSGAPNKVFREYLKTGKYLSGITLIKPEAKFGSSRFDFYVEADCSLTNNKRKIFIEVKGVTLEIENCAFFPDAPTERGIKHLNELIMCTQKGYEAHVVFVIQMDSMKQFSPNNATHPAFGETLYKAQKTGVKVTALDCTVTPDSLLISNAVPVII